jgi:hypothetical protein
MSCWHGWHGCGHWYGPPPDPGWYGPADWYDEPDWRARRRPRRGRRADPEEVAEDLTNRLEELREELRRTEAELADLQERQRAAVG